MKVWGASIGTAMVGSFVLYLAIKGRLGVVLGYMLGSAQTGSGTVGGAVSGVVQSVTGTPGASVSATVQPIVGTVPNTGGL